MTANETDETLFKELEPIVHAMGFDIVELKSIIKKTGPRVFIVIYRKEGLDLKACSDVLKTLRPRIQAIMENPDVAIEVSSPGIERVIKNKREYGIFLKRGIKLLIEGKSDWLGGILTKADENHLELTLKGCTKTIEFSVIKKAKLDYGQEVE